MLPGRLPSRKVNPQPSTGPESPASLQADAPVTHEVPWPLNQSRSLPPLDRPQSFTGFEPLFAPRRPHSPSGAYLPGPSAEPHVEARHREMVGYNFATFMHHPEAPMRPAGQVTLGRAHADALLDFRNRIAAMPDQSHAYAQTYRVENGSMVQVHPEPVPGFMTEVTIPSGSYPAGTSLVIHSHPPRVDGGPGRPSEADLMRAYHDRTNALQHPGSNVAAHILYDRGTDQAFLYDGRLGPDGNPQFFHAVAPAPDLPDTVIRQEVPIAQPTALRRVDTGLLDGSIPHAPSPAQAAEPNPMTAPLAAETEFPAFFFPPRPEDAAPASPRPASPQATAPRSPDWDQWMEFPASRPETPASPTPWDQWMNFDP